MANYLDYFIRTNRTYRGTVYSSGRQGMNEREKFEKWMEKDGIELATLSEKCAAFEGWQAALSTRKAYGYGIVDKTGFFYGAWRSENRVKDECAYKESFIQKIAQSDIPHYRVVELFYEDSES